MKIRPIVASALVLLSVLVSSLLCARENPIPYSQWHSIHGDGAAQSSHALEQTRQLVAAFDSAAVADGATAIFNTADSGALIWDCVDCPQLVIASAGSFQIGSGDDEVGRGKTEGPRKRVFLRKPFAVAKYDVTRGQYESFLQATGRAIRGGCVTDRALKGTWAPESHTNLRDPGFRQTDDHPVVCVTWDDAIAYVSWLSERTHHHYRLLSEAEWEYLARAGTNTIYPWGNSANGACRFANIADATAHKRYPEWSTVDCDDGAMNTSPVGTYEANAFGLFDMIGNIGTWLQDCATMDYETLPLDGSPNLSGDCTRRHVRGGSWGAVPKDARVAKRLRYPATQVDDSVGIRVARDL